MKKYLGLVLFSAVMLLGSSAYAQWAVFDAVSDANDMIKQMMDKTYQTLDLDISAEELGIESEQLDNLIETLKTAKETYELGVEQYEKVTWIGDNIGDPTKIAAFVNEEFTNIESLDEAISISKKVMNADPEDLLDFDYAEKLLKDADSVLGTSSTGESKEVYKKSSERNADQVKRAKTVDEMADKFAEESKEKLEKLNKQNKSLDPKSSSLIEISYGTFQGNMYLAELLSRMHSADLAHYKNMAKLTENMANEQQNKINLAAGTAIVEKKADEAGTAYLEDKNSTERTDELFKNCRKW